MLGLALDVPDFGKERWQFLVFLDLQTEAHLRVHVAEGSEFREDRQELREV